MGSTVVAIPDSDNVAIPAPSLGVGKGKRFQKHAVDHVENCAVSADAQPSVNTAIAVKR